MENSNKSYNALEALAHARREFGEHGGVNLSIEASTTFTVLDPDHLPEIFRGERGPDKGGCFLYGRHFNPTVYTLSRQIAAVEGTETCYCCASGMAAISSTLIQCCSPGDHIIASDTLYGGTFALLKDFLPAKCGIRTTFVDITDTAKVEAAIEEKTRLIYTETLSNPTLLVPDMRLLSQTAKKKGLRLVVDNTFTPMIFNPCRLGADIVVHSLTKFINGASDIIAGAICGSKEFIQSLMDLHQGALMLLGPTMDPQAAFDISLRIPHLALRMKEHSARALFLAQRLEEKGLKVRYPGLLSHPQHQLFKEQMNAEYGFGGIFSLDTGSFDKAKCLMACLQNECGFGFMAVSLGYFDTLMSCSASTTSSELTEDELHRAGITQGLLRISVGYTGSVEERWNQLEKGLRDTGLI